MSTSPIFCRRPTLRILYGKEDTSGKYPYVVAIVSEYNRHCTGALITREWVLTAAHCITDIESTHIQHGDMTFLPNATKTKSKIIKQIPHPNYYSNREINDIGLLNVAPVFIEVYGQLSSVDYSSLIGLAVNYAGLGATQYTYLDEMRPVLIGEGVIRSCNDQRLDAFYSLGPFMCVAPKCSNKLADSAHGDSGGPLFYDDKIIGVVSMSYYEHEPIGLYTAVSPFVTWIRQMIAQNN